jgi:hypothetical protein
VLDGLFGSLGDCWGNVRIRIRSTDGGTSWERWPAEIAATCENVGSPRVTTIAIDPLNLRCAFLEVCLVAPAVSYRGSITLLPTAYFERLAVYGLLYLTPVITNSDAAGNG